jgi:hypothetical protein
MDAYVLPYEYQSLKPDVTYDWVFRLGDDLPVGGSIILYFPANFYDLQSSVPCPTVELVQGVTWINPATNPNVAAALSCNAIWATSIGKITQINPVKKGEVIVLRIKGVKNPSQEGWTPYFQIETRNQENYIIDRLQTIPQVYITRKFDVKNIIFDGFFMVPNNGQIIGNYYLSFYPQTPIPANGMIEVTLPSAEFSPGTSFPAKKFCRVGGSLKTFRDCTWSATNPVIQIFLDKRFEVEAGQEPIRLHFPHIKNFNAELSSGVVKVTTYFDGLVLDESGSEETNRKCFTVKTAAVLAVSNFDYYPRNEGNIATYKFRMTPTIAVGTEGVITLEFPYEFPKGLGTNIVCRSAQLLIGALDPLWCKADDWFLRITNHKGWVAGVPVDIEIFGIVNPNRTPLITDQIGVYLFNTKESVTEYNYGIGPLAFTAAPMPLLETGFTTTNALPRFLVTNTHTLVSTVTSATINQVH